MTPFRGLGLLLAAEQLQSIADPLLILIRHALDKLIQPWAKLRDVATVVAWSGVLDAHIRREKQSNLKMDSPLTKAPRKRKSKESNCFSVYVRICMCVCVIPEPMYLGALG